MEQKNYEELVNSFYKRISGISESTASIKLAEDKWSLKEIVGHLIDSASNNHQRFVRLQMDDLLGFPPYDAEQWVKIQNYQTMCWDKLISLWYTYNEMLIHLIEGIDPNTLSNVWVREEEAIPLEYLVTDYYRHMKVHMEQFENRLKETEGE